MTTTYDDLMASDCTSCRVKQDKSAYWTPTMNFIYQNGTTVVVPQIGGMLAYYLLFGENIQPFPKDFRMLAGDTRLRDFPGPFPDKPKSEWGPADKTQLLLGQKALGFNCLDYTPGKVPEASMYRHRMPSKEYMDANCKDGIRAELFFPSCWNGETDSKDHKSHMRYPDLVNGGECPKGFETRVPSLFYETIWNTAAFKDEEGQFVFANGDPTGCGYHGDFMTGWDVDFLGKAINDCTDPSGEIQACKHFDIQSEAEGATCTFKMPKELKNDNCDGPADGLCGNVPIQDGPGYASALPAGDSKTPTGGYIPPTSIAPVPTLSYKAPVSAITDKYGGGISVAAVNAGLSKAPEAPTMVISVSSAPASSAAPVTTAPAAPVVEDGTIISTSTYTSAGTVYEVAIKEIDITVTVEPTPAARLRRHAHHMHRRDREHGLLGRY
ncbi:hypothetical protein BCR34DRAFT_210422 [Clohesyomyces aquaticus]|uniref:DUF1996 domain-containing protein n=1 Tax=Clohesyomyces aquaticus TaxID=1231657 RepID=A0A1Y2A9R6_9PLEO|nr:hypothetical protein BCR34DRAFT_210422 [Clohesyomyces aquaticus]